jgi:hypothetical protein
MAGNRSAADATSCARRPGLPSGVLLATHASEPISFDSLQYPEIGLRRHLSRGLHRPAGSSKMNHGPLFQSGRTTMKTRRFSAETMTGNHICCEHCLSERCHLRLRRLRPPANPRLHQKHLRIDSNAPGHRKEDRASTSRVAKALKVERPNRHPRGDAGKERVSLRGNAFLRLFCPVPHR